MCLPQIGQFYKMAYVYNFYSIFNPVYVLNHFILISTLHVPLLSTYENRDIECWRQSNQSKDLVTYFNMTSISFL